MAALLTAAISADDIDEDLAFATALQMSLAAAPGSPAGSGGTSGAAVASPAAGQSLEEQMLQQALNASLGITSPPSLSSPLVAAAVAPASPGPLPSRNQQLISRDDESQEELMARVEQAKAEASSSAKKRRKSAKKLARRNRRSNSGAGVGDIIIANTVNDMSDDELRSELRRLVVPFPWPSDHDGLAEMLKNVISVRAKKSGGGNKTNGDPSPIRPKKKRSDRRKKRGKQRKFVPSGDAFAKEEEGNGNSKSNDGASPEGVNAIDSDDLILKQVLAASLQDVRGGGGGGGIGTHNGGRPGGFNHGTRTLHNSLAMREQVQLERAMEKNAEDYERQMVFASLESEAVRVEAEACYARLMDEFRRRGGARPSTDFVISLARDTVKRREEEASVVAESRRVAEAAEQEREAAREREEEQAAIQTRNNESRQARAARFAASFDRRQGGSSCKKSTPG